MDWIRSSFCKADDPMCVEVLVSAEQVAVRDSKHPHDAVLVFTTDEWDAFKLGIIAGDFD